MGSVFAPSQCSQWYRSGLGSPLNNGCVLQYFGITAHLVPLKAQKNNHIKTHHFLDMAISVTIFFTRLFNYNLNTGYISIKSQIYILFTNLKEKVQVLHQIACFDCWRIVSCSGKGCQYLFLFLLVFLPVFTHEKRLDFWGDDKCLIAWGSIACGCCNFYLIENFLVQLLLCASWCALEARMTHYHLYRHMWYYTKRMGFMEMRWPNFSDILNWNNP